MSPGSLNIKQLIKTLVSVASVYSLSCSLSPQFKKITALNPIEILYMFACQVWALHKEKNSI